MKNKFQYGQGELFSFFLLLFFTSVILGIYYCFSVFRNMTLKTIKEYQTRIKSEKIISAFEKDFQVMTSSKSDSKVSEQIMYLCEKYSEYNINISDVSSGINLNTLSKKFLSDRKLQELLFNDEESFKKVLQIQEKNKYLESKKLISLYLTDFGKKNITYYGWINNSFTDAHLSKHVKGNSEYVINSQSSLNIYFTDSEIIRYFIAYPEFNIIEPNEKCKKLINEIEINSNIDKEKIKKILGVNENNKILNLLGVKTQFFQILLEIDNAKISLIICALPGNDKEIEKYRIIKREINL